LEDRIQAVSWKHILKHSLLGKGAFSEVYQVCIDIPEFYDKKYALKHLSPKITDKNEGDFDLAAIDLATEANLLSRLKHDNIISLHGIYGGELKSSYIDCDRGYFLLLDLLHDTLPKRLERDRKKEKLRILSGSISSSKMMERIKNIALGVSKGLEYLHSQRVIFRDLKPDNVGFRKDGTPVIFDFGFAREVHTLESQEVAGSLRYMSPEMAFGLDPSLPSDVYSFGVLMFELCTLEKPFKPFKDQSVFNEHVLVKNYRPPVTAIPSKDIKELITSCWDPDHAKRPSMTSVVKRLRVEATLSSGMMQERTHHKTGSCSKLSVHSNIAFQRFTRRNSMGTSNCGWNTSGATIGPSAPLAKQALRNSSFHRGNGISPTSTLTSIDLPEKAMTKNSINEVSDQNFSDLCPGKSNTAKTTCLSTTSSGSDLANSNQSADSTLNPPSSTKNAEFSLGRLRKPLFRRMSFK